MGLAPQSLDMATTVSSTGTEWRRIDEWDGGAGWMAHPEESMKRASHALDGEEGVWLVDPVDCDGLDEFLAERGEVAGVLTLLDRHKRDAAALARRYDVAVHVPEFMDDVPDELDARVEPLRHGVPGTEYSVRKLIDNPFWQEAILVGQETGTLVVPEALGTSSYYCTDEERVGVSPPLRLKPPRSLRRVTPERILVGHGEGVFDDAAAALDTALDGARRRAPRLYWKIVSELVL